MELTEEDACELKVQYASVLSYELFK
jgi:hypothetical protein